MSDVAGRHTLKYPVKVGEGEEQLTEIVIRRPIARDFRFMDVGRTDVEKAIILLAGLSGLPQSTIEELDAEDFTILADMIGADAPA